MGFFFFINFSLYPSKQAINEWLIKGDEQPKGFNRFVKKIKTILCKLGIYISLIASSSHQTMEAFSPWSNPERGPKIKTQFIEKKFFKNRHERT